MRAEFFHADEPDTLVGSATWNGRSTAIDAGGDADVHDVLERIFRPIPVVADDPALRPVGSTGPVLLEPGDLRWFMTAARSRGASEGLGVRLVVDDAGGMGWDPAGAYRPFLSVVAPAGPPLTPPDQPAAGRAPTG